MDPPLAAQITAVLLVPVTEAVNCCLRPDCRAACVGVIEIATVAPELAVTVTLAVAVLLLSTTLSAATVTEELEGTVDGAV